MSGRWRVGKKVKLNVYEGSRPVCQCHNVEDAKRIVEAMNLPPAVVADAQHGQRFTVTSRVEFPKAKP